MRSLSTIVLAVSVLSSCAGEKEKKSDLGAAAANTAVDTATLRESQAAVNDVIRNAADCDAAKPLLAGAKAKLDEAEGRLRTPAGRETLNAQRNQLRAVEQACP